jgi:hypothetical protein
MANYVDNVQVIEQFCPKEESRLDSFMFGDEAAREFADWLMNETAQQAPSSLSPRPSSHSPRALSSTNSTGAAAFFASPGSQRRFAQQQLQQQQPKTSASLTRGRQEASPTLMEAKITNKISIINNNYIIN